MQNQANDKSQFEGIEESSPSGPGSGREREREAGNATGNVTRKGCERERNRDTGIGDGRQITESTW